MTNIQALLRLGRMEGLDMTTVEREDVAGACERCGDVVRNEPCGAGEKRVVAYSARGDETVAHTYCAACWCGWKN